MVGSNPAFDPAVFRASIRSTMNMGLPVPVEERPTFRWSVKADYAIEDPASKPYNWTATPTNVETHPDVQVPCAVEFAARPAGSTETTLGQFDVSRVIVTILDEDYAQVRGADVILVGTNTYDVDFVGPPLGLFEVTVYQIFATARDET